MVKDNICDLHQPQQGPGSIAIFMGSSFVGEHVCNDNIDRFRRIDNGQTDDKLTEGQTNRRLNWRQTN